MKIAAQKIPLDKVQSGKASFCHRLAVSRGVEGPLLVYSTATPPDPDNEEPSLPLPEEPPARELYQDHRLQHEAWTPKALRKVIKFGSKQGAGKGSLYQRARNGLYDRWFIAAVKAEVPLATMDEWCALVWSWLDGADLDFAAERIGVSRAWAFEVVAEFVATLSFFLFADDLRAACRTRHQFGSGSGGGTGNTASRGCDSCTLLAGASWDGWVSVPAQAGQEKP